MHHQVVISAIKRKLEYTPAKKEKEKNVSEIENEQALWKQFRNFYPR